MKVKPIIIETPKGKRTIGPGQPVFIIAEMSGNHNQSYARAKKMIDAAVKADVDAIKLQTYTADTLTIDSNQKWFQVKVNDAWAGQTLYSLYQKAYTPWAWQPKLKAYAEKKGVLLFSSPFDASAVDFLENLQVQLYKVASFEIGDIPLLKKIGATKKPVIVSSGLASAAEISLAIKTLKTAGAPQVGVLHCVSSYPAVPEQMNLATIAAIAKKFNVVAGLSDHTLGIAVPVAATALGASIIEKHFTLRRSDGGPDAAFSLEPDELRELVLSVRMAQRAVGKPTYAIGKKEAENIVFKKSLFVVADIAKGERFTEKNVRVIRPGYGLAPRFYAAVMGKRASKDIERGTPLAEKLIKN